METVEGTTEVTSEQALQDGIETGPESTEQEEVNTLPSDDTFEVPEKFKGKSAEEIARAYVELERFKGDTPPAEKPPEEIETQEGNDKYLNEFYETGELSEDSYAELLEAAHTREQVDEQVEFEKYKQHKQVTEVADIVGGMENYNAMEQWATKEYSEEDRTAFVSEFQSAGPLAKKAMLENMYSQSTSANAGGDVVHTNEYQGIKGKGYQSQFELQQDMSDKRYGTDRSYTAMVEAKLNKSNLDKL